MTTTRPDSFVPLLAWPARPVDLEMRRPFTYAEWRRPLLHPPGALASHAGAGRVHGMPIGEMAADADRVWPGLEPQVNVEVLDIDGRMLFLA